MERLNGKVAIVTGSARGLGGAAASALAREGASVVVADILDDEGHAKVDEITAAGGAARFASLDVRDADAWARVVDECVAAYGGLDVLVNNAGLNLPRTIDDADLDEFKRVMDVNLYGPFLGTKAALPALKARGAGSIINVSSNSTEMIVPTTTYYAASKAALANLTKTTAVHLATKGHQIRANSIHPGPHSTPMIDEQLPHVQKMLATVPLGRFGRPEDFGQLVVFLGSDESSYITAAEFFIDGGLSRVSYANERG